MSHNSNFCPEFHKAVELIGKRWSGAIVREMLAGATRFTDLMHAIPSLSERMLCARLRGLEEEGVVERRVGPGTPVRVEYHLTEKGRELGPVFAAVGEWADRWIGGRPACPEASRGTARVGSNAVTRDAPGGTAQDA